MIYLSWNYRGIHSRNNEATIRDLIRTENPIVLVYETKMEDLKKVRI